jgi:hypothetical protein
MAPDPCLWKNGPDSGNRFLLRRPPFDSRSPLPALLSFQALHNTGNTLDKIGNNKVGQMVPNELLGKMPMRPSTLEC